MTKIRDILVHVSVETAIRGRKCHRNKKHRVQPGKNLLSIRESGSLGSKNYCDPCAKEILVLASEKIKTIVERFETK